MADGWEYYLHLAGAVDPEQVELVGKVGQVLPDGLAGGCLAGEQAVVVDAPFSTNEVGLHAAHVIIGYGVLCHE